MIKKQWLGAALVGGACSMSPVLHADATLDDLRKTVEAQQQAIDKLQKQLDATAAAVEEGGRPGASGTTGANDAKSGATRIGGYGELHYNNLDSKKELDFHRFVLYFAHQFSDTIRFNSEVELEHSVSSAEDVGEVELEQAFLEFDLNEKHTARTGVFLIPVGILNETHEPPTFYGVERNPIETNIIPSTWWEGGASLAGELAPGWKYDIALTSGLNTPTSGANAYLVRNGRQEVAQAVAEDLAYTARLRWTGWAGVELSGTAQYQQDITQGAQDVSATLLETHAVINQGRFGLRALYATWLLDGAGPEAVGRDEQSGWYIEPSYKVTPRLGVFARYNAWDNEAGGSADSDKNQTNVGVNYWPHENVVLKADIQRQGGTVNDDGFNLGVGYQF